MVRSLSAAIPQIVPVVTTDVGHLVGSPVVAAVETIAVKTAVVETAAVAISALSQTRAAVKIAPVAIADLSQTRTAVKFAPVAIAELSQAEAAVVHIDPDSDAEVSADLESKPAVPVAAGKTILGPAARHHAIGARLRSH